MWLRVICSKVTWRVISSREGGSWEQGETPLSVLAGKERGAQRRGERRGAVPGPETEHRQGIHSSRRRGEVCGWEAVISQVFTESPTLLPLCSGAGEKEAQSG